MRSIDCMLPEQCLPQGKTHAEVLIVDDDPEILAMLKSVLERKNLICETALSANEALSMIETSPGLKLVLLDIIMPEINGLELLRMIRKITPSIHVIMITGGVDIPTAIKCLELGAKDYIQKPFDLEYLETSIITGMLPLL